MKEGSGFSRRVLAALAAAFPLVAAVSEAAAEGAASAVAEALAAAAAAEASVAAGALAAAAAAGASAAEEAPGAVVSTVDPYLLPRRSGLSGTAFFLFNITSTHPGAILSIEKGGRPYAGYCPDRGG